MGARVSCSCSRGARVPASPQQDRSAVDLHRRRPQAVDLRISRRGRVRAREAARYIEALRPIATSARSISRSFRAVPRAARFVNDVCADIDKAPARPDAFQYDETDRFPLRLRCSAENRQPSASWRRTVRRAARRDRGREIAPAVATGATVRDRETGLRAGDSPGRHRHAVPHAREPSRVRGGARGAAASPSYVYKGLGFFDADEIKDVLALLWYLADPRRICDAAACCDRASFGCRTRR